MRQLKEIKGMPIGKGEVKASLFVDDIIIYIKDSKNSTKNLYRWRGGLNLSDSHWFIYFNVWLAVGGSIWVGLGGMAFLKEVCQWGCLWVFKIPCQAQSLVFCHMLMVHLDVSSQYCSSTRLPICCHATCQDGYELTWNYKKIPQLNVSFDQLSWSWCFFTATE